MAVGNLVTTGSIKHLLQPLIRDLVLSNVINGAEQWMPIYTKLTTTKQVEVDAMMFTAGPAQFVEQGAPIPMGDMGEQFIITYYMRKFGIGFVITREAIMFNQYKNEWKPGSQSVSNSLIFAKCLESMTLFENAFSATSPVYDGKPLCDQAHATNGASFSNSVLIPSQFSQDGLKEGILLSQRILTPGGLKAKPRALGLLVPEALQFDAIEVLDSKGKPNTNWNNPNFLKGGENIDLNTSQKSYIEHETLVNHYLVNQNAWFILTDYKDQGLKYYEAMKVKHDIFTDTYTGNLVNTFSEMYAFGCSDIRAVIGNQGS